MPDRYFDQVVGGLILPSIPLPFLTAIFLGLILLRLWIAGGRHSSVLLLVTLAFYCIQSILVGVNWGISALPPLTLALVAIVLPPLTWLALKDLSGRVGMGDTARVCGVVCALALGIYASFLRGYGYGPDAIIALTYLGYGTALILKARGEGIGWAETQPFHLVVPARLAFISAGILFILSAVVDVVVGLDFAITGGKSAAGIVAAANVVVLASLGALYVFVTSGQHRAVETEVSARDEPAVSDTQRDLVVRLKARLSQDQLYRDEDLSLQSLSKTVGAPPRMVSEAVNAVEGLNVPQFVNGFRVAEACERLRTTDQTVTEIMFAVGFATKSNFNKEFQRVTGLSPSAFRTQSRSALDQSA